MWRLLVIVLVVPLRRAAADYVGLLAVPSDPANTDVTSEASEFVGM